MLLLVIAITTETITRVLNRKRSEVNDPCLKQCIICILKGEPGAKYSAKLEETELTKLGKSTEGV